MTTDGRIALKILNVLLFNIRSSLCHNQITNTRQVSRMFHSGRCVADVSVNEILSRHHLADKLVEIYKDKYNKIYI